MLKEKKTIDCPYCRGVFLKEIEYDEDIRMKMLGQCPHCKGYIAINFGPAIVVMKYDKQRV